GRTLFSPPIAKPGWLGTNQPKRRPQEGANTAEATPTGKPNWKSQTHYSAAGCYQERPDLEALKSSPNLAGVDPPVARHMRRVRRFVRPRVLPRLGSDAGHRRYRPKPPHQSYPQFGPRTVGGFVPECRPAPSDPKLPPSACQSPLRQHEPQSR